MADYPDLRLSFEPDAIRDHFEGDDVYGPITEGMTEEELAEVGEWALTSDSLYRIFHELLVASVDTVLAENDEEV